MHENDKEEWEKFGESQECIKLDGSEKVEELEETEEIMAITRFGEVGGVGGIGEVGGEDIRRRR